MPPGMQTARNVFIDSFESKNNKVMLPRNLSFSLFITQKETNATGLPQYREVCSFTDNFSLAALVSNDCIIGSVGKWFSVIRSLPVVLVLFRFKYNTAVPVEHGYAGIATTVSG